MSRSRAFFWAASLAIALTTHGQAAVVSVSGTIYSLQTPAGPHGSTVDHWKFTVTEPNSPVDIDVLSWEEDLQGNYVDVNGDGESAFFDSYIRLFRDDGSLDVADLIAENDGGFATFGDGSVHYLDSIISTALDTGSYILAISSVFLSTSDAIGSTNPNGTSIFTYDPSSGFLTHDHGDYRITFTGDVLVPESPGLALAAIAGATLLISSAIRTRLRHSARQ
jgi:hypothetical protein